ncbi:MAG: GNAT family N-acetyltransferase [archaeon]
MKIRKAKKEDIKGCLEIQKLDKKISFQIEDLRGAFKNKDVIFLVAEDNKKIIGYVLGYIDPCARKDVLISESRVDKRFRRRGIGTKLVSAFCKECFNRNKKEVVALIKLEHLKFYHGSCKFKKRTNWIDVSRKK